MTITLDGTLGITSPAETTTNLAYTGTLTGGTGVVNLGSGQVYKDAAGNVGVGITSPLGALHVAHTGPQLTAGNLGVSIVAGGVKNNCIAILDSANTSPVAISNLDGVMCFHTGLPELGTTTGAGFRRASIDVDGNLLVGVNSTLLAGTSSIVNSTVGQLTTAHTANTAGKYYKFGNTSDAAPYFIIENEAGTGVYIAPGGTSWTGVSDERLKTDIKPIENAAEKVSTLRTVTGRFKADEIGKSRCFLFAQDVLKVLPEAVDIKDDELGTLGLSYSDVIPLLTAAIKELKAIIDTQQARITALEARV